MDYQPGILARIEDADDLLDRAAESPTPAPTPSPTCTRS
jgi:hypothetical protein